LTLVHPQILNSIVYFSLQSYGLLAWISLLIFLTFRAGASIHACHMASRHIMAIRHIMAMEADKEIFKSLIEP
jgi:hypothetical protein